MQRIGSKMEVYLDNNSTTQIDTRVQNIYIDSMKTFANVNVKYNKGNDTRELLNNAYDTLYEELGADDKDDIILTSSASEGNNTVIKTFLDAFLKGSTKNHIISTIDEDSSILSALLYCKEMGMKITYLDTHENGQIDIKELESSITPNTSLISILMASSYTGAIQNTQEISKIAKKNNVYLHCDGSQAIGKMEIDVADLGVDYLSFSAHKFHGPKGIGALYVKEDVPFIPLIHGTKNIMGGKRAGSLYNNGVAAMATALEIANINLSYFNNTIQTLRNKLEDELLKINGSKSYIKREHRLDNSLAISFDKVKNETIQWNMNKNNIYISTASQDEIKIEKNNDIIVFSLSRFTTEEEIDYVIKKVNLAVDKIKNIKSN